MKKIVAVFGSARVQPDSDVYVQSYEIGKALAQAGYVTMTGGYAGVMEAASRGANEANGEVQGITVESLEYIGESRVNQWVREEIRYATLPERVRHLVDKADAYIVMPGGLGTIQELVEVWQGMRLGDVPHRPLILYGNFWHPLIENLLGGGYISERDLRYVIETAKPKGIINALEDWFTRET